MKKLIYLITSNFLIIEKIINKMSVFMKNKIINKFTKEISLEENDSIKDLFERITNDPDLREDYIFRGMSDKTWKLIPSSLRDYDPLKDFLEDKYIDRYSEEFFRPDLKVMVDFLNRADKSGLKVFTNNIIRKEIENPNKRVSSEWPTIDWFEIISLAQHYGLPTCALDWSYDYKVALYFAVIDCLNDKKSKDENIDCVLWAFNYKKFNKLNNIFGGFESLGARWKNGILVIDEYMDRLEQFPLLCYRPAYYDNLNLNAQKGLLTFWCKLKDFWPNPSEKKSFDEIIIDNLDKLNEWCEHNKKDKIELQKDEKLFYKFIIPARLKSSILEELYKEGYSEEYLFPGYEGVVKAMKNKHKLENKKNSNE